MKNTSKWATFGNDDDGRPAPARLIASMRFTRAFHIQGELTS
jgi:hypothetical protein